MKLMQKKDVDFNIKKIILIKKDYCENSSFLLYFNKYTNTLFRLTTFLK